MTDSASSPPACPAPNAAGRYQDNTAGSRQDPADRRSMYRKRASCTWQRGVGQHGASNASIWHPPEGGPGERSRRVNRSRHQPWSVWARLCDPRRLKSERTRFRRDNRRGLGSERSRPRLASSRMRFSPVTRLPPERPPARCRSLLRLRRNPDPSGMRTPAMRLSACSPLRLWRDNRSTGWRPPRAPRATPR